MEVGALRRLTGIVATVLILALAASASAAPGDLDPTFGQGGVVRHSVTSLADVARAGVIDAQGRIIVAGHGWNGGTSSSMVARFLPDGTLDDSFARHGRRFIDLAPGQPEGGSLLDVLLLPDGRILALGTAFSDAEPFDAVLVRLTARGGLDPKFGQGGLVRIPVEGVRRAGGMVRLADGRIVVVGTRTGPDGSHPFLARMHAEGSLDGTFADGGVAAFAPADPWYLEVGDLALAPNGDAVFVGRTAAGDLAVGRADPAGELDEAFGDDGFRTVDLGSPFDRANDVAVRPDGKIVVGGSRFSGGVTRAWALLQFLPDGTPDPGFGTAGQTLSPVGSANGLASIASIVVQDDGRIVAGGTADNARGLPKFFAGRYLPDGTPDSAFGGDGFVTYPIADNQERAQEVLVQSDGRIVLVGRAWRRSKRHDYNIDDVALMRILPT